MPTRKQIIGRRIRERREDQGLGQEALARLLPGAVTGQQISNYERGKNEPLPPRLREIAHALNVTTEELLDGVPSAPLTQLDRVERKLDLLLDAIGVDWAAEFTRAAAPTLAAFEAHAETARQDAAPPADTPGREDAEPAPGRTRPRHAGRPNA